MELRRAGRTGTLTIAQGLPAVAPHPAALAGPPHEIAAAFERIAALRGGVAPDAPSPANGGVHSGAGITGPTVPGPGSDRYAVRHDRLLECSIANCGHRWQRIPPGSSVVSKGAHHELAYCT